MAKQITRIVLTGGPAAGKTTLISRILKEFKREDGWRVITIPESATDLIAGFGIKPFDNCVSMLDFQYFVIADQLHKEKLAVKGAEMVPEEKVLIIYDRALFDDKAYITDEEFRTVLGYFGKTEEEVLAGYTAVLHLVTCAKGAEFAYNFDNAARYEDIETAREKDDLTLHAWSRHPNLHVIDNSVNFEDKISRAIQCISGLVGQPAPQLEKHKFLIECPDCAEIVEKYNAIGVEMVQTYLRSSDPRVERRVRKQKGLSDNLYFYTEKNTAEDGSCWVTEHPLSEKEYLGYLKDADTALAPVSKLKYRFAFDHYNAEIDVYPFSPEKAVMFIYSQDGSVNVPEGIKIIREVTGDPEYKNRALAARQAL